MPNINYSRSKKNKNKKCILDLKGLFINALHEFFSDDYLFFFKLLKTILFSSESISKYTCFLPIIHFYYYPCTCPEAKHCFCDLLCLLAF